MWNEFDFYTQRPRETLVIVGGLVRNCILYCRFVLLRPLGFFSSLKEVTKNQKRDKEDRDG